MTYSNKFFNKTRIIISAALAGVVLLGLVDRAGAMELSVTQKADILAEAETAFDRGSATLPTNPVSARSDFQEAASKYQLLVDSGVNTGELFYNLGNAYLKADQLGLAIANYKRACLLLGPNQQLEENLRYARSLCKSNNTNEDKKMSSLLNDWNQHFSASTRVWLGLVAWLVFWSALIARLFIKEKFRWRYVLAVSVIIFTTMAGSVGYETFMQAKNTQGVVTASSAPVLKGNGEGFAKKFKEPLTEGTEFHVMEHRGQWLHIKLADDKTGWINAAKAEVIKPRSLWG